MGDEFEAIGMDLPEEEEDGSEKKGTKGGYFSKYD